MTDPTDVADWISENVPLSPPATPLRLSGYQRALVEALADPAVMVRFLTPAEMRRAEHRREAAHLMLWAALEGREVGVYERTAGDKTT